MLKKDIPKSMTIKLKGGGFVDPDSKLEDKAHVLKVSFSRLVPYPNRETHVFKAKHVFSPCHIYILL